MTNMHLFYKSPSTLLPYGTHKNSVWVFHKNLFGSFIRWCLMCVTNPMACNYLLKLKHSVCSVNEKLYFIFFLDCLLIFEFDFNLLHFRRCHPCSWWNFFFFVANLFCNWKFKCVQLLVQNVSHLKSANRRYSPNLSFAIILTIALLNAFKTKYRQIIKNLHEASYLFMQIFTNYYMQNRL